MSQPAGPLAVLYVTCPDADTATTLAELAIERRLAACANILPQMRAVYRWEGQITQADEQLLILKTTEDLGAALMAMLEEAHPYDLPAILQLPAQASPAFTVWVTSEVMG